MYERAKLQAVLHLYVVLLLAGYDIQTTVGPVTGLILHLGKMADILSADVCTCAYSACCRIEVPKICIISAPIMYMR
jgi:hypothetical protein